MTASLYDDPELYDRLFAPGAYAPFYAEEARRAAGPVLELACGTGQLLLPIAQSGVRAVGVDLAAPMLTVARRRAGSLGVAAEFVEGDMRTFDLGERFALVFVARNSLLHLASVDDFVACFRSVRRHLLPGGAFVFDVFNPDVRILAQAPGERVPLMRVPYPVRGEVLVEATHDYDAASQVNRSTWHFSAAGAPDFLTVPLHLRSIFPQELPLLLAAGGLRLEARFGDHARAPFHGGSRHQVCVCRT